RPLKTEKDYLKKIGTEIELSLYKAINGEKKLVGILSSYSGDDLVLSTDKGELTIQTKDIALAKPYIRF
ncbi:MAG: ribosome maturation factor RimP, partial [Clostridia bacterium]|nr:ribosome maturation factor RimP [Clostridia bacterium]